MDIMRPLCVHIDVTHGTATPAQPDPQTVHLNAAQSRKQPPGKNGLATLKTACPPQNPQQRKEMPLQGAEIPTTKTAHAPQSQPQRKKMPLLGTDFAAVDTAHPPQTQSQRMEMPLLDVDSPNMGAAFPPEFSQQRMEMPCPEIDPSAMGAAYPPHSQPQRRKMPLPETQILAPPITESSLPSASATALPASQPPMFRCRLFRRVPPCPTPLAALCSCRPRPSLQRRLASSAAITHGLPRTSYFVLATLCRRLSPAFQSSLVVQSSGLPYTITGQSLSSFTQDRILASSR